MIPGETERLSNFPQILQVVVNPDSTLSSLVFHCLTDDDGAIYFP